MKREREYVKKKTIDSRCRLHYAVGVERRTHLCEHLFIAYANSCDSFKNVE